MWKTFKIYLFIIILQFLWGLGLREDEAECFDVYGLDLELLDMVPKPVLAVLFLYPLTSQVFFYTICFFLALVWFFFFIFFFNVKCFNSPQSEEERILQANEKKVSAIASLCKLLLLLKMVFSYFTFFFRYAFLVSCDQDWLVNNQQFKNFD